MKKKIKKGIYELGYYKGNMFLKVFHHSTANNESFTIENEALYHISKDKFSILANISDKMKVDEKYEFIINYPIEKQYFRWRQSKNPLEEDEESGNAYVDGYELIYNSTKYHENWGGLVKTTLLNGGKINTLLNGLPGNSLWYFAIGMYKDRTYLWEGMRIPAYNSPIGTSYVSLWIKLPFPLHLIFSCKYVWRSRIYLNYIFLLNYFNMCINK